MSLAELSDGRKVQLSDGRFGTIRFAGQTSFAPGVWVGVELEDATGKNDGSVQGHRYFDCVMGHGMFVRPATLKLLAGPPASFYPQGAKKKARPSSTTSSKGSAPTDPTFNKRMSANISPTPAPKPVRTASTSSSVKGPTKSPTKQLGTAPSLAAPPRVASGGRQPGKPHPGPMHNARPVGIPSRTSTPAGRPPTVPSRTGSGASLPSATAAPRPTSGTSIVNTKPAGAPKLGTTTAVAKPTAGNKTTDVTPQADVSATRNSPIDVKSSSAVAVTARPAAALAAAHKEIDDLKAKLRVIEKKRIDDREKISTLDKVQSERDRFEKIIQTLQNKYQPQQQELADLRRQLKDAETRFHNVEKIQEEHESALELATLDREMAEEMAEVYKTEVDSLKQKTEELELELDILREEHAEFTKGMSLEDRASTGWIQMEKNNERLREALIRLRDISREQEDDFRSEIKGLREDVIEFEAVKEQFEACKVDLAQREAAVEDLREQLDNALGAEDIIESLTEQTMNQAEKIKELEATIEELVELKEIGDEMDANHIQHEKELQQEIDTKDAFIAEQIRQSAIDKKSMDDMEYTLSRFRELVTNLQGDLADMRASHAVTENESEQLDARSRAMLDLNLKLQISASKTQVKTIDLELRRMEAQEAEQHLEVVKFFLPDAYQSDKDSVLALLRFKRLAFKANLLNDFIKDRVNGQAHPGHEDDVFNGCDAVDKLTWVAAMCNRFVNTINHCSLEQFAKYDGALFELEPVERALNGWIDSLKRDELKEKQCSAELQRTIALMTHLSEVHLSNDLESFADDIHMKALLMQSHLESAAAAFTTLTSMVQRAFPQIDDDELGHFLKKAEAAITSTRSAKVIAGKTARALEDLKTRSLSLLPDTLDAFELCEISTMQLATLSRTMGLDLHSLLHEEGRNDPITIVEILSCVNSSGTDAFAVYINKLRAITAQISDLASLSVDLTQTQEFERSPAPWILRSEQLKSLKTIPIEAEAESRRLKDDLTNVRRTLAIREEDFSTAQLKIETLESRMRDAKAKASRISELESEIETTKEHITNLSDSISKQDRELKALEVDRDKWKQVASTTRAAAGSSTDTITKPNQEQAVANARELDNLRTEVDNLQASVRYLREDSRRARTKEQQNHDWLSEPLNKNLRPAQHRPARIVSESRIVLGDLVNVAARARIFDMGGLPADKAAWKPARSTPQYHAARQMEEFGAWKGRGARVAELRRTFKGKSPARDGGESAGLR